MSCNQSIVLTPCPTGTTWDGLTECSFYSAGTAFAVDLESVVMEFTNNDGTVGLTLSSADNEITIDDAAAWEFTVLPIDSMPLAVGNWKWSITTTDVDGSVKRRVFGTIQII